MTQKIQDIRSIRKLKEEVEQFEALLKIWPCLRPILRLLKVDVKTIEEQFPKFEELKIQIEELIVIPDRFNEKFSEMGWIIYEEMNLDVAKKALEMAEQGDPEAAEEILVTYYNTETIRFWLQQMNAIKAYQPRHDLALKALDDYAAERYHACVPVILALLDGLVNELHERRRGFFSDEAELEAWDSLSAHEKGLGAIVKIFRKGRRKTTTERITVPYRHGIMHGMDLGYDNKIVAAKCWATLLSIRTWAIKSERKELEEQPEEPQPRWRDILREMSEIEDFKKHLREWKPRILTVGVDYPKSGSPEDYGPGTPERAVVEFLNLWQRKNYGFMSKMLLSAFDANPANVRERYHDKEIVSFTIDQIRDEAPAITEVDVDVVYRQSGEEQSRRKTFRLVYSDQEGQPGIRDNGGAEWKLVWWDAEFERL